MEGLRLWRVCAMYDVCVASLDAMWPLLAARFAGPAAGSGGGAASGAHRTVLADALAREALLTAAELVCHAARCAGSKPQTLTNLSFAFDDRPD